MFRTAVDGYMPASWQGRELGFECSVIPPSDLPETYPEIDFGGIGLRLGVLRLHVSGCAGAWKAVACVDRLGGIAFDLQEGSLIAAEDAIRSAHEALTSLVRDEASSGGAPAG